MIHLSFEISAEDGEIDDADNEGLDGLLDWLLAKQRAGAIVTYDLQEFV